jgi:GntR family transcriptional regulator
MAAQLADLLRQGIESGEYPAGSTLPSEPELAARYGVTRQTVNRAEQILRAEGLIRVERGRGTIVRPIPVIQRQAATRYKKEQRERDGGRGAFYAEITAMGLEPETVTEISREIPPPDVAAVLEVNPDAESVVVRRRKMYASGEPVQLAPSYIPADIANGTALAELDSGPGGIISRFAELGYPQDRITEKVRIRRCTPEEADFLRLEDSQFVAEIFHVGWSGERAVEVCVHSLPAAQWELDYELPVS